MRFRKVNQYHAVSESGEYTICRFFAGKVSTYMAWRGKELIDRFTFAHEYDSGGRELDNYAGRAEAYRAALAACETDEAKQNV